MRWLILGLLASAEVISLNRALEPVPVLEGTVYDGRAINPKPLPKAKVVVFARPNPGVPVAVVEADERGHYSVPNLEPGEYAIYICSPDCVSKKVTLKQDQSLTLDLEFSFVKDSTRGVSIGSRETGRKILSGQRNEEPGYGLYSYLLLGSKASTQVTRDRHLKGIEAYLEQTEDITKYLKYHQKNELNVFFLPLNAEAEMEDNRDLDGINVQYRPLSSTAPYSPCNLACLVNNYDYARARELLRKFPNTPGDGPYLVSVPQPLGAMKNVPSRYLYQDLSTVPPKLVHLWVKEFVVRAAQERFWDQRALPQLGIYLRTAIGTLDASVPILPATADWMVKWADKP